MIRITFQIAENDNFPQNICSKCETTMFDAFMFKQKSVKSHNLLQQILKMSNDESNKTEMEPIAIERKSQSTQTQNDPGEFSEIAEVEKEIPPTKESRIELQFTGENEDETADDVWQFVYENEEQTLDEQSKDVDDMELINDAQEEMSSQSNETSGNTMKIKTHLDCVHCGEYIPLQEWQIHLNQHTKMLPYLLNSTEFFRCNRCFSTFPFIDDLFDHMGADTLCEPSEELTQDDVCTDYQYLANDPPIRLFSASRNENSDTYSCSLCLFDFEDIYLFQSHFEEAHLSTDDCDSEYLRSVLMHSCGICGNSFKTLHDALHHVYFHQSIYPCIYEDCEQLFESFLLLCAHFNNEHPEVRPKCSHCSYLAKNGDDLRAHQRKSCTARNLKCGVCG